MQTCAALALFATTWRHLIDYNIPKVFLCLPLALLVLPLLFRFTPSLFEDAFTRTAVIGVLSGVNCGFLTTISNTYKSHVIYMQTEHLPSTGLNEFIQCMELLHLPVIILSLLDSFLRVFNRFPSPRSLQTAAVTALIADLIIVICLLLPEDKRYSSTEVLQIFIVAYVHLLLVSCLPLFKETSRAWLLMICATSILMQWEVMGLGCATWHPSKFLFPVPGYFIGIVYVFHSRGGWPSEDTVKKPVLPVEMVRGPYEGQFLITSIHWHSIAFIFERVALHGIYGKNINSDTVSSCVLVAVQVYLMSPYFTATKTMRVAAVLGAILSYFLHTMIHEQLLNPFVCDAVLGMSFIAITNVADKAKSEDSPFIKTSIM